MVTYYELKRHTSVIAITTMLVALSGYVCGNGCEVNVTLPWEDKTFVPEGSSVVFINCTATVNDESDSLDWFIQFVDRQIDYRFVIPRDNKLLNDRGFYELLPTNETIRLIINNTIGINGTVLRCANIFSGNILQVTTLLVYEPTNLQISRANDVGLHSVNLTWSSSEIQNQLNRGINQNYNLTVVTNGSTISSKSFQLQESFYVFTAPEYAPPCEVYNFSVTQISPTYVGATYTGADCSVSSPVISMMLPSLPDINKLESTLKYSLTRQSNNPERIKITVVFTHAKSCGSYPVTGYVLKVEGPTSSHLATQTPSRNSMSVESLFADQIYIFNVIVSNIVGSVSTSDRKIFTTDLQKVTIVPFEEEVHTFLVQCIFWTGSIAKGCMVVLVSELNQTMTVKLTRNDQLCVSDTKVAPLQVSEYIEVLGYVIGSDERIGTLAVPGVILENGSSIIPCIPGGLSSDSYTPLPSWLVGVISAVIVLATIFVAIMFIIIICIVMRRSKRRSDLKYYFHVSRHIPPISPNSTSDHKALFLEEDTNTKATVPVYDLPDKYITERKVVDGSCAGDIHYDNTTCSQRIPESKIDDVKVHDDNIEHTYHVLESPHHHLSENGASSKERFSSVKAAASSGSHEIPVYQDIVELSKIKSIVDEHESQPHSTLDSKLAVPVYQAIAELNTYVEGSNSQEQKETPTYAQIQSAGTSV